MKPTVDAVIPTLGSRASLVRAVRTAVAELGGRGMVWVALDQSAGAEHDRVVARLAPLGDHVQVIVAGRAGVSEARNAGIRSSTADFIALLDDDDYWLPGKMEAQLSLVRRHGERTLLATRCLMQSPRGLVETLPRKAPPAPVLISDYLFRRVRPGRFSGYVATPSLMVARELALEAPFPSDFHVFEDFAWMLKMEEAFGTHIAFVPAPLTVVSLRPKPPCSMIEAKAFAAMYLAPLDERAARSFVMAAVSRQTDMRTFEKMGEILSMRGSWHPLEAVAILRSLGRSMLSE